MCLAKFEFAPREVSAAYKCDTPHYSITAKRLNKYESSSRIALFIYLLQVWKAKEPGSDIVVALKMIKATDKEGNSCDVCIGGSQVYQF